MHLIECYSEFSLYWRCQAAFYANYNRLWRIGTYGILFSEKTKSPFGTKLGRLFCNEISNKHLFGDGDWSR